MCLMSSVFFCPHKLVYSRDLAMQLLFPCRFLCRVGEQHESGTEDALLSVLPCITQALLPPCHSNKPLSHPVAHLHHAASCTPHTYAAHTHTHIHTPVCAQPPPHPDTAIPSSPTDFSPLSVPGGSWETS